MGRTVVTCGTSCCGAQHQVRRSSERPNAAAAIYTFARRIEQRPHFPSTLRTAHARQLQDNLDDLIPSKGYEYRPGGVLCLKPWPNLFGTGSAVTIR